MNGTADAEAVNYGQFQNENKPSSTNGAACYDSTRLQAWLVGTVDDVMDFGNRACKWIRPYAPIGVIQGGQGSIRS